MLKTTNSLYIVLIWLGPLWAQNQPPVLTVPTHYIQEVGQVLDVLLKAEDPEGDSIWWRPLLLDPLINWEAPPELLRPLEISDLPNGLAGTSRAVVRVSDSTGFNDYTITMVGLAHAEPLRLPSGNRVRRGPVALAPPVEVRVDLTPGPKAGAVLRYSDVWALHFSKRGLAFVTKDSNRVDCMPIPAGRAQVKVRWAPDSVGVEHVSFAYRTDKELDAGEGWRRLPSKTRLTLERLGSADSLLEIGGTVPVDVYRVQAFSQGVAVASLDVRDPRHTNARTQQLKGQLGAPWAIVGKEVRVAMATYLAPNGNDLNTGLSPDSPLLTIEAAAARTLSGGIIYFASGLYRQRWPKRIARHVSFRRQPGDRGRVSFIAPD